MAALTAELKEWLAARTAEEKRAIRDSLNHDLAEPANIAPFEHVPGSTDALRDTACNQAESAQLINRYMSDPTVIEEIRHRRNHPEKLVSIEEFMDELENLVRTKSEKFAGSTGN